MPTTNQEGIDTLKALLKEQERDYAWLARRLGSTHQWVARRMNAETPMKLDDYGRMLKILQRELVTR